MLFFGLISGTLMPDLWAFALASAYEQPFLVSHVPFILRTQKSLSPPPPQSPRCSFHKNIGSDSHMISVAGDKRLCWLVTAIGEYNRWQRGENLEGVIPPIHGTLQCPLAQKGTCEAVLQVCFCARPCVICVVYVLLRRGIYEHVPGEGLSLRVYVMWGGGVWGALGLPKPKYTPVRPLRSTEYTMSHLNIQLLKCCFDRMKFCAKWICSVPMRDFRSGSLVGCVSNYSTKVKKGKDFP
jgi:hypothetical protein